MVNVGDIRVFYSKENRDRKARELEKMGYRIEKYSGLLNYFLKVLSVPDVENKHFDTLYEAE